MYKRLKKRNLRDSIRSKYKATDVLYDKMVFYHEKAEKIALFLIKVVEQNNISRGDLLVALHKDMNQFNNIAIECASKLAPYQSPKLESIEVKKDITHRFVVVAPKVINDSTTWLKTTMQFEPPMKLINGGGNGKIKIVEDIEVIN